MSIDKLLPPARKRDSVPLAHLAFRAFGWNTVSLLLLACSQMGYTAVTSRALPARAFGIYAVGQAIAAIAGYFSLASLGNAVMRHPDSADERHLLGSSMIAATLAGLMCSAIVFAVAGLWARAWHLPDATGLVRLEALPVGLAPPTSVLLGLLRRRLRFRAAAVTELAGSLFGFGAGLVLVLAMRDPRALVLGQATGVAATVFIAALALRPLRFGFKRDLGLDLSRFGAQVGAQNLVYYAIYNAPPFTVSRLFGAASLGLYSRANLLISLPLTWGTQALSRALYPLFGQLTSNPDREQRAVTDVLVVASFVSFTFFAAIAAAADPIVRLLLGEHFLGAITYVRFFAVFGAVNVLVTMSGVVQEVRRWMSDVWQVQAIKLLVLATGLPLVAVASRHVTSVLVVFCASQVIGHAAQLVKLRARGVVELRRTANAYAQHGAWAGLAFLTLFAMNFILHHRPIAVLGADFLLLLLLSVVCWRSRTRVRGLSVLDRRGLFGALGTR